uniref:Uncharacterized protein n=1 Tax=Rhizophora mucronata TaxID=61149 RepID=A0A2P2QBQ3_RHIMU
MEECPHAPMILTTHISFHYFILLFCDTYNRRIYVQSTITCPLPH